MRIAVLTSLYPSRERPHEGVFAERRWLGMRVRGHELRVVHPLPWAPLSFGRSDWAEIGRMPEREERGGVPIERPRYLHVPRRARANARAFARAGMAALDAGAAPDVVVADYAWPAAAASKACADLGRPFVISGRGSDVLQVASIPRLRDELASALRRSSGWCGVSEHLVRAMDELAGEERGVLVANGVDGELFRPREKAACRAELQLEAGDPRVLVVGHLIDRKAPLLALDVFARWSERHAPRARLDFLGRGPLHAELEADVVRRGLATRVQLRGEAPPERLASWYGAADALLLVSTREGRPNVVLEALSSGLPVLATDAGGTEELLGEASPMLARTRDPDELAERLQALLAAPPNVSELRSLAERWSWDSGLAALEALLERAIASRGERGR